MPRLSTDLAPVTNSGTLELWVFTAAIFLSALLLFGVQPMFARMVLPQLGGSPSVWSVAMVFFQSMLLGGYAYAHLLTQTRRRWLAITIHVGLMVGAVCMLPLSIARAGVRLQTRERPFGCSAFSQFRLAYRFLRSQLTIHFCKPGSYAPVIGKAAIPVLYAASNVGSFLALLVSLAVGANSYFAYPRLALDRRLCSAGLADHGLCRPHAPCRAAHTTP